MRAQAGDDTGLTPKQKLERKKQQEAQRREMELQAATVDLNKDRGMAAQRKQVRGQAAHAAAPLSHQHPPTPQSSGRGPAQAASQGPGEVT